MNTVAFRGPSCLFLSLAEKKFIFLHDVMQPCAEMDRAV